MRKVIDDNNMYKYFEELLYGEKSKLKTDWRCPGGESLYGLTNYDLKSFLGSKELLYRQEDAEKQLCLLETMQKFLNDYVGIEGLEELLVNNYGTIENSIFFEHNQYGEPQNIREHAKHQLKNAYLGSMLLLEYGYLKDVASVICQEEGAATRYMMSQVYKVMGETADKKVILEKTEELAYKIFMVSSLLHDIGYPLEFYLRSAQQLADYPPYLNLLSPVIKRDFAEVKADLLESQLFRQMDIRAIKEKYDQNNHGVLSAISLLMRFYHNGRIYSLDEQQKCLVEMSALAIYKHTDRWPKGFRMVYLHDPVSYMVRLCDDLQEWDRFKIQIEDKHNYLQCGKCGKLINENQQIYSCNCGQTYKKITSIFNRKVSYICLCDRLIIETIKNTVQINLDFNLMKQIEILLNDFTAVLKSDRDLNKVKGFLDNQCIRPQVEIVYFVSNNPIRLIDKMIERSEKSEREIRDLIGKGRKNKKKENMLRFFEDYLDNKRKNLFGKPLETNVMKYGKIVQEYVRENMGKYIVYIKCLSDW